MFCCPHLKILIFWARGLHFHFARGTTNYGTLPAWLLFSFLNSSRNRNPNRAIHSRKRMFYFLGFWVACRLDPVPMTHSQGQMLEGEACSDRRREQLVFILECRVSKKRGERNQETLSGVVSMNSLDWNSFPVESSRVETAWCIHAYGTWNIQPHSRHLYII